MSKEIVKQVAEKTGLSQAQVKQTIDALWSSITEAAKDGQVVRFSKWGAFGARTSSARKGRNPQTGAVIEIGAKTRLYFKQSSSISEELNENA